MGLFQGAAPSCVSIHALAWRATYFYGILLTISCRFNSCPRVEGNILNLIDYKWDMVSIHALAWRATIGVSVVAKPKLGFNSCPRVEGNEADAYFWACRVVSIHALAWRATADVHNISYFCYAFLLYRWF